MKIYVSTSYIKTHRKLTKRNIPLLQKIKDTLVLFQEDPLRPSLRLHKLTGREIDEWSISVNRDIRIIFQYIPEGILLTEVGSHDEVY